MNIVDKLIKKIEKEEINEMDQLLIELNVISSLINNVDEKLNGLKELADKRYKIEKSDYALSRTIALETAINFVEINLVKGDD